VTAGRTVPVTDVAASPVCSLSPHVGDEMCGTYFSNLV
jgi:hypothetical protein